MWQSYALGSVIAKAFGGITDKAAFVRDTRVDTYIASFYRMFFFSIVAIIVGYAGVLGTLHFFFHWVILIVAPIEVLASVMYTQLLRQVEITSIAAVGYVAPIIFFLIDTLLLGVHLTPTQTLGIILLAFGGIAFSIDGKTHHFKRMPLKTWSSIFFVFVVTIGAEAYSFKYLNTTYDINGLSFYATLEIVVALILLGLVVYKRKTSQLFSRPARVYVPYALAGKSLDVFYSVMYTSAITIASVSQVSAFVALTPLMLFLFTATAQTFFKIRLHENLDHKHTPWKLGAMVVLVVGGLLVT